MDPGRVSGPYFNPRTREGCDVRGMRVRVDMATISIHAPVKGATTGLRVYVAGGL